jgi:hypothetical protein
VKWRFFNNYALEERRVSFWYTSNIDMNPLVIPARMKVTNNAAMNFVWKCDVDDRNVFNVITERSHPPLLQR